MHIKEAKEAVGIRKDCAMKTDYFIRCYKEGDEIQINDHFNEIFNEKRSLQEWEWKFKRSPVSDLNLIIVAEAAGKIVGHYASIPMILHCMGERIMVVQPVDTFVHPDYRGTKVLVEMSRRHEDVYLERGYIGVFGFPNRQAYVVGKRILKYADLFKLSELSYRLNLRQSFKYRFKHLPASLEKTIQKASSKYYSISLSRQQHELGVIDGYTFDQCVDDLWNRVCGHFPILCVRDLPYLRWRYLSVPSKEYHVVAVGKGEEVNGYLVYTIREMEETVEGVIVDCLWADDAALRALVMAALGRLSEEGVDYALFRVNKATALYEVITELGFSGEGNRAEVPVVYYFAKSHAALENAVRDPSLWYFTYGDSDGI